MSHKNNLLTPDNCANFPRSSWKLPGDVKYKVDKKLERLGRIGVRLSDFLSSFLQNVDGKQDYGECFSFRKTNLPSHNLPFDKLHKYPLP